MFRNSKTFSSYAVPDVDAARTFYADTLGLQVSDDEMGFIALDLEGGQRVMLYPKDDFTPATYTVLNFEVDDIDAAVDALTEKGVEIERYDTFEHDEKGIVRDERGPAIAWFTDPFGNVLSVLAT